MPFDLGRHLETTITETEKQMLKGSTRSAGWGTLEGGLIGAGMGGVPGAAVGAAGGAVFGKLFKMSKNISKTWEQLERTSKEMNTIFKSVSAQAAKRVAETERQTRVQKRQWAKVTEGISKQLHEATLKREQRESNLQIRQFKLDEKKMQRQLIVNEALTRVSLSMQETWMTIKEGFRGFKEKIFGAGIWGKFIDKLGDWLGMGDSEGGLNRFSLKRTQGDRQKFGRGAHKGASAFEAWSQRPSIYDTSMGERVAEEAKKTEKEAAENRKRQFERDTRPEPVPFLKRKFFLDDKSFEPAPEGATPEEKKIHKRKKQREFPSLWKILASTRNVPAPSVQPSITGQALASAFNADIPDIPHGPEGPKLTEKGTIPTRDEAAEMVKEQQTQDGDFENINEKLMDRFGTEKIKEKKQEQEQEQEPLYAVSRQQPQSMNRQNILGLGSGLSEMLQLLESVNAPLYDLLRKRKAEQRLAEYKLRTQLAYL